MRRFAALRPVAPRAVPAALLLAFSLVGGLFPEFSPAANRYVLGLGAALVALGWSGRLPQRPAPDRLPRRPAPDRLSRAAAWWLLPALLLVALELVDLLAGSTPARPTLSGLLDPVLARYPGRVAGYLAWLGAFWSLVRR